MLFLIFRLCNSEIFLILDFIIQKYNF